MSLDPARGITYKVVKLTPKEVVAAAGPAPGSGQGASSFATLEAGPYW